MMQSVGGKEDQDYLRATTVASYLNIDNMPSGRWINDKKIAELLSFGTAKVQRAIASASATPTAGRGTKDGGHSRNANDKSRRGSEGPARGKGSGDKRRINKLIERLHRANKLGTVDDTVMQEVLIGPLEGGVVEARLKARKEGKGTEPARLSR